MLDFVLFGDPLIAAAESAESFTEGQVYVQADLWGVRKLVVHRSQPGFLARSHGLPVRHRWVAGIAWYRAVVFCDQTHVE